MSRFEKKHRSILEGLNSGLSLKKMVGSAWGGLDDGFILSKSENGLTGFSEVMESNVQYLESMGFIENVGDQYIITRDGKIKIGVEKRSKRKPKKYSV